ncbi:MAG: hypothetical protein LBU20_01830 [Candidatus Nomurabacteria bacterium]|jgi:hypothetical protein|nr:hypothetical protein [Candidatus Nomurabacteria bacterium]
MKYSYEVRLDKAKDAWNWYDATRNRKFQGCDWRDSLRSKFLEKFDEIANLKPAEAKKCSRDFVEKLHRERFSEYDTLKKWIENDFCGKFDDACEWLEKITGHELSCKKFMIALTTFPRAPYFAETGLIYFNIYWTNPIETFMHEVLHFQFETFWRDDKKSPVSKLSTEEFEFLKESLTVALDDDVKPLIRYADKGYPAHQDFRKLLHEEWKKHHDFNKLVNFGLKHLPN